MFMKYLGTSTGEFCEQGEAIAGDFVFSFKCPETACLAQHCFSIFKIPFALTAEASGHPTKASPVGRLSL